MRSNVNFGLAIDAGSAFGPPYERIKQLEPLIDAGERYGFDSIWFGESYPSGRDDPRAFHSTSALMLIASMAHKTSLELGTGVTLLPAWSSKRLILDAALVHNLTGGRLNLGVGLGPKDLAKQFGVNVTKKWADDYVSELREFFSDESSSEWSGNCKGPKLLVGGGVRQSAIRAAHLGDGWFASTGYTRSRIARLANEYWTNALERRPPRGSGRTESSVVVNRFTVVSDTASRALDAAQHATTLISSAYRDFGTFARSTTCLYGDVLWVSCPEGISESIRDFLSEGVTSINFRVAAAGLSQGDALQSVKLLGEEVIPRFR